jgi:hypothetical protein
VIKSTELTADSYTVDWPIPKNMTKAAWYALVLVQCENGTLNSYCQVSRLLLLLLLKGVHCVVAEVVVQHLAAHQHLLEGASTLRAMSASRPACKVVI